MICRLRSGIRNPLHIDDRLIQHIGGPRKLRYQFRQFMIQQICASCDAAELISAPQVFLIDFLCQIAVCHSRQDIRQTFQRGDDSADHYDHYNKSNHNRTARKNIHLIYNFTEKGRIHSFIQKRINNRNYFRTQNTNRKQRQNQNIHP